MGWKLIESAPKDGLPMMLIAPDGRIGIGFLEKRGHDGISFISGSAAWIGKRWGDSINVSLGGYSPEEATHWMPLPDPPK